MTAEIPSAGAPGRIRIGWGAAIGFAALVTVVGAAASFVIMFVADVVFGFGLVQTIPSLATSAAGVAALATVLHALLLRGLPPQSRWGVLFRAVAVSYLAVALLSGLLLMSLYFAGLAVALFTVSGAFLVPAAVAALCAPILDPRLRRWRGTPPTALPTGRSAPRP